jgi:hypothetical protein
MAALPAIGSAATTMHFAVVLLTAAIGGPGKWFDGFAES